MSNATVEELVEGLKSKETFDARAAILGATAAQSTVRLLSDGKSAGELMELQQEIQNAEWEQRTHAAGEEGNGGITHDPEWEVWEAKLTELRAREKELATKILASAITFHVRGVSPKVRNLIVKSWNRKFPDPKRERFGAGVEGDEEFEAAVRENLGDRNRAINDEWIAKAIFKVVDPEGREDTSVWSAEDVEKIYEFFYPTEYGKLIEEVNKVSLASTLFKNDLLDADFLSKP